MRRARLLRLLVPLLWLAGPAFAAVGTVTWTPNPPPTVGGIVQPYTDFRLYRCLGGPAICPTANAALWTLQDTFPVADCTAGTPPCTATTTVLAGPGTSVTMSFYMTARIGTGAGQETGPSPVVSAIVPGGPDVPFLPPGGFSIQFSALAVPLRVAQGYVKPNPNHPGEGILVVAAGESPFTPDVAVLIMPSLGDHRRRHS